MNDSGELVVVLKAALRRHGFGEVARGRMGGVDFAGVLARQAPRGRRVLCAVVPVPKDVGLLDDISGFANDIRRGLSGYFSPLPWPKRLGTFTVLSCGSAQAKILRSQRDKLVDCGGMHVNVMLGTIIVDVENSRSTCDNVWGLMDTGGQFKHIHNAVEAWCLNNRAQKSAGWSNGAPTVPVRSAAHQARASMV